MGTEDHHDDHHDGDPQTAAEAHDGQHLGTPRHLDHVRHGPQGIPREVPRFEPRSAGGICVLLMFIKILTLNSSNYPLL